MQVVTSVLEMERLSLKAQAHGEKIVFVPTMGALHEGHLPLFREGKKRGDLLVVSIFVNPTQFNDRIDYEKYPRNLPADLKKCETAGVEIVFVPEEGEIYPPGELRKKIAVPAVALPMEGKSRPGYFEGVVRIVSRLFDIVHPTVAVFGQKDYQQLRVIEEMVEEQDRPVAIIPHPIVRNSEGLALSSRNERLSPEGRTRALALSRSLQKAESLFSEGEREAARIAEAVRKELSTEPQITIDYVEVVDARTLERTDSIRRTALVAVAALIDGIRLIDNCLLNRKI